MAEPDKAELFIVQLSGIERSLALYVMTLVPRPQDAEDILQQSKLVMWRCFDQFQPGTNFGAWARKIAFHQVLTYRKRQKKNQLQVSDEFLEIIASEVESNDEALEVQRQLLTQCMAKLDAEHRQILNLRYHEGAEIEDIAEQTQKTEGAVYRLLSRIRKNLHECVTRSIKKENAYEPEAT
jgi:RNA polymerase sigma-70 factor (ECF subfamily)